MPAERFDFRNAADQISPRCLIARHPHMKRRDLIALLGGAAARPLAARAQQFGSAALSKAQVP